MCWHMSLIPAAGRSNLASPVQLKQSGISPVALIM
ncbi:hypothetical protein HU200_039818 [Digitaria exilis]|uniref:Uncharacterized protein n=1 Tax=Digitaria exilis TaxID=1010633 RepID=A0A835BAC6_9POAL|nr:hypothetical protein HU200_039818 [Digitaria exilis]